MVLHHTLDQGHFVEMNILTQMDFILRLFAIALLWQDKSDYLLHFKVKLSGKRYQTTCTVTFATTLATTNVSSISALWDYRGH